jgi:hypothetical protein
MKEDYMIKKRIIKPYDLCGSTIQVINERNMSLLTFTVIHFVIYIGTTEINANNINPEDAISKITHNQN